MKIGRTKISRRKLVDTKIGRYENWLLRKLVVAKISREERVVESITIFKNHNINNFRVSARVTLTLIMNPQPTILQQLESLARNL